MSQVNEDATYNITPGGSANSCGYDGRGNRTSQVNEDATTLPAA
jgi:hypothetical protein